MDLASPLPLVETSGAVHYASIPLFTAVIGWITNATGVWMLFYPVRFRGVRVPGLAALAQLLPRKVLQVPLGIRNGHLGWQGIIPSRAAKMGSVAVDKGLSKLGTQAEFYEQLDPDVIARHILHTSDKEIDALIDNLVKTWYPTLWATAPGRVRDAIHDRLAGQLPEIARSVTRGIGSDIDQILDVKIMVIRHMEQDPALANKVFYEVGKRELRMIVHFGFLFGLLLGVPLVFVTAVFPHWWVLPVAGVVIGHVTNWLAIAAIFEPVQPRRIGPLRIQGLFLRRQREVADIYARIIADEVITLDNISRELFHGPSGDRTSRVIERHLRPAVTRAVDSVHIPLRFTLGQRQYRSMTGTMARKAGQFSDVSLRDAAFSRKQSENIYRLVAERMRSMGPADFAESLRSAIKEDEWLLILHGAALGLLAGALHVVVFGA
ncbi:hypothetical protein [Salinifilum ghardaiensis]